MKQYTARQGMNLVTVDGISYQIVTAGSTIFVDKKDYDLIEEALKRLSVAGLARDAELSNVSNLIEVMDELRKAVQHANDVLEAIHGPYPDKSEPHDVSTDIVDTNDPNYMG